MTGAEDTVDTSRKSPVSFLPEDDGTSLMEYALIILFVVLLVIVPLTLLGTNVLALFNAFVGAF